MSPLTSQPNETEISMSTRSLIGTPNGDGFRGRYKHSDGYPSGTLPDLLALVKRDGAAKVVQTLTVDHYGWSALYTEQEPPEYSVNTLEDERFEWVPGYGIAYTDTVIEGFRGEPYQQVTADEWLGYGPGDDSWRDSEWAYVIDADNSRLTVFDCHYDAPKLVASIDLNDIEAVDLSALCEAAEA
jgi:hypothetical protein